MQTLHKGKITLSKITAGSCYNVKRGKVTEEPQKNGKESCYKGLVTQRKHYLSLARKSF